MKWLRGAAFAQVLLTAYWILVTCVPLGAWNRQPGSEPILVSLRNGKLNTGAVTFFGSFLVPGALFLLGYIRAIPWLMWIAVIFDSVWLGLQFKGWWVPYIFGASEKWRETYVRVFSDSYRFLPTFGNHLVPDAMHFLLQFLLLIAIATGAIGLVKSSRTKDRAVTKSRG
jgi:hypothetical protein